MQAEAVVSLKDGRNISVEFPDWCEGGIGPLECVHCGAPGELGTECERCGGKCWTGRR